MQLVISAPAYCPNSAWGLGNGEKGVDRAHVGYWSSRRVTACNRMHRLLQSSERGLNNGLAELASSIHAFGQCNPSP